MITTSSPIPPDNIKTFPIFPPPPGVLFDVGASIVTVLISLADVAVAVAVWAAVAVAVAFLVGVGVTPGLGFTVGTAVGNVPPPFGGDVGVGVGITGGDVGVGTGVAVGGCVGTGVAVGGCVGTGVAVGGSEVGVGSSAADAAIADVPAPLEWLVITIPMIPNVANSKKRLQSMPTVSIR
jgi:hypothetical protein